MSLMFSQSALKWSTASALEHVETFAGMMSVTRGEWKDPLEGLVGCMSNVPGGTPGSPYGP